MPDAGLAALGGNVAEPTMLMRRQNDMAAFACCPDRNDSIVVSAEREPAIRGRPPHVWVHMCCG